MRMDESVVYVYIFDDVVVVYWIGSMRYCEIERKYENDYKTIHK